MKKYLPYLLLIVILGGVAAWVFLYQSPESINKREGEFAVKDVKAITKIVLEDTEKNRVELTKTAKGWMVNNKYIVRDELINQLLGVISKLESLSPVPANGHDNVMREMIDHHVKAEIYTGGQQPAKSYWVGGPNVEKNGTYMLLQVGDNPASRPHITYVPDYRGYVTPVYCTDEETWRSRILYNITDIKKLESLAIDYPAKPGNSFSLARVSDDSFAVYPLNQKYAVNQPLTEKYVQQYLGFYSSISVEAFDNSNEKKDSIIYTTPFCSIATSYTDKSTDTVKIFYMPVNKRSKSQYDDNGKEITYDIDRYYASLNHDKDFAIVQYYVMGKLFRHYHDFYFKPS